MSGFKAKMQQIRFPLGSAPDSAGVITALPRPLSVGLLNGPISKPREGEGRGMERGREGKAKESEGETRWREGFGPSKNFGVAPLWTHTPIDRRRSVVSSRRNWCLEQSSTSCHVRTVSDCIPKLSVSLQLLFLITSLYHIFVVPTQ